MLATQVLVDLGVVLVSCYAGLKLGEFIVGGWVKEPPREMLIQLWALTAAVCLVTFHFFGMYSPVKSLLNVEELKAIAKSTIVAFLVLFTLIIFLRSSPPVDDKGMFAIVRWVHQKIDLGDSGRVRADTAAPSTETSSSIP